MNTYCIFFKWKINEYMILGEKNRIRSENISSKKKNKKNGKYVKTVEMTPNSSIRYILSLNICAPNCLKNT